MTSEHARLRRAVCTLCGWTSEEYAEHKHAWDAMLVHENGEEHQRRYRDMIDVQESVGTETGPAVVESRAAGPGSIRWPRLRVPAGLRKLAVGRSRATPAAALATLALLVVVMAVNAGACARSTVTVAPEPAVTATPERPIGTAALGGLSTQTAVPPGTPTPTVVPAATATPAPTATLTLAPGFGRVVGTVHYPDGQPVVGVLVRLMAPIPGALGLTDTDGRYELDAEPGRYELQVVPSGEELGVSGVYEGRLDGRERYGGWYQSVVVVDGETLTIQLVVLSVAPESATFYGTASVGDVIGAFVPHSSAGAVPCGTAVVVRSDGSWAINIAEDAPCLPSDGGLVYFTLNSITAGSETWTPGGLAREVSLAPTPTPTAAPTPAPTPTPTLTLPGGIRVNGPGPFLELMANAMTLLRMWEPDAHGDVERYLTEIHWQAEGLTFPTRAIASVDRTTGVVTVYGEVAANTFFSPTFISRSYQFITAAGVLVHEACHVKRGQQELPVDEDACGQAGGEVWNALVAAVSPEFDDRPLLSLDEASP